MLNMVWMLLNHRPILRAPTVALTLHHYLNMFQGKDIQQKVLNMKSPLSIFTVPQATIDGAKNMLFFNTIFEIFKSAFIAASLVKKNIG